MVRAESRSFPRLGAELSIAGVQRGATGQAEPELRPAGGRGASRTQQGAQARGPRGGRGIQVVLTGRGAHRMLLLFLSQALCLQSRCCHSDPSQPEVGPVTRQWARLLWSRFLLPPAPTSLQQTQRPPLTIH